VLEIGAGTGLNLAHYPNEFDELVLSEPVGPMARRLEARLRRSGVNGSVLHAGAEALPVVSGSVDTVVSTLVLCTVPDPEAAIRESIERLERAEWRGIPGLVRPLIVGEATVRT
jgi:ubiquinone/menaquinone biosynthesis C-methylase UbiE